MVATIIHLYSPFLWSQVFGALCFVLDLIRFLQTSRTKILIWGVPIGISLIVTQMLNNQYQGAAMSLASMTSSLSQAPFSLDTQRHQQIRLSLGLIFGAIGVWLSPPGILWISWLPLAGYLVGRIGELTHDFIRMRTVWLVSTIIFMSYHFLMRNWMTGLTEVLVLGMSIRFLYLAKKNYATHPLTNIIALARKHLRIIYESATKGHRPRLGQFLGRTPVPLRPAGRRSRCVVRGEA
ncbi:MAG: YgjV family protein [Thiomonas sp.]